MNIPGFTAEASLRLRAAPAHREDTWNYGAGAGMAPTQLGELTPALRVAPNLKPGDTWCDGTTMWRYQCTPSPYPGSPPDCRRWELSRWSVWPLLARFCRCAMNAEPN
jgi:hypothetical protein